MQNEFKKKIKAARERPKHKKNHLIPFSDAPRRALVFFLLARGGTTRSYKTKRISRTSASQPSAVYTLKLFSSSSSSRISVKQKQKKKKRKKEGTKQEKVKKFSVALPCVEIIIFCTQIGQFCTIIINIHIIHN